MTTVDPLLARLVDFHALATAVLLAAAAALAAVRQPARRLAIGRSALWGLLALLIVTLLPAWPRVSLAPRPAAVASPFSVPPAPTPAAAIPPRPVPAVASSRSPAVAPAPAMVAEVRPAEPRITLPAASDLATGAFAVGSGLATAWLALGAWQLARLRRRSRPAPIEAEAALSRVVEDGAAAPALLVSDDLPQPVAAGVARPTIILPARFLGEPAERLEAALAHEWGHIRNGDLRLIALSRLLLPALFAHPLYWWLRARIRDDQEALADAAASGVGGPIRYAETLLNWSRNARESSWLAAGGSAALFERPSQIKRRIAMLLDPKFRIEAHCPTRWRVAARIVAASAVAAASLVTLRPPALADDQPAAPSKAPATPASLPAPAPAADDLTAKLIDPDGNPVAGAKVYLDDSWNATLSGTPVATMTPLGETGPDGSFRYPVSVRPHFLRPSPPDSRPDPSYGNRAVVTAEGFGPAFVDATTEDEGGTIRLVSDDAPIQGRVVDAQGRPVAGASVRVEQIRWTPSGSLDAWLADLKAGRVTNALHPEGFRHWRPLPAGDDALLPEVETDREGRFTIRGVGRERMAMLRVEGPGIEATYQYVATRDMADIEGLLYPGFEQGPRFVIHGARFDLAARPGRAAVGTATEQGTGKPVAGATVGFGLGDDGPYQTATTDAEGRYRVDGLPMTDLQPQNGRAMVSVSHGRLDLSVQPPQGVPLFSSRAIVGRANRPDEIAVDFQLRRGVKVKGRLVEKGTGRGVQGSVEARSVPQSDPLRPLDSNDKGDGLVELPPDSHLPSRLDWKLTDQDGNFDLLLMPGPCLIAARVNDGPYRRGAGVETITGPKWKYLGFDRTAGPLPHFQPYDYNAVLGVDPAEGHAEIACEVVLDRGHEVKGRVLGPDGEPLAGGSIIGDLEYLYRGSGGPMPSAEFTVLKLVPNAPRDLFVYHTQKGFAGSAVVQPDEAGSVTLRLQPAGGLTGRLVDLAGKPVPNWRIGGRVPYGDPKHESAYAGPATTDAEGRFHFKNLVPGRKHTFITWKSNPPQNVAEGYGEMVVAEGVVAASGETKDLGDVVRDIHP